MNDYIEFLCTLAKGISKKHKRDITLSCDLSRLMNHTGSWYQIVTNNKIDKEFKNKLKTNIKEHLPDNVYNYLVMKSIDNENNLKDLLNYSGWEVLELLLETVSHDTDLRSFFIELNKEKFEIIPVGKKDSIII